MSRKIIVVVGLCLATASIFLVRHLASGDPKPREMSQAPVTPPDQSENLITIYGPPGFKQILTALEPMMANSPLPYTFQIWDGNSEKAGIDGLLDGTFDMIIIMRRPGPDEGVAFREFVRTPIAIFVHPGVGLTQLTRAQVAAILTGEVTNWSEIGGPDLPIVVLNQGDDDSMAQMVRSEFLDNRPVTESARILPDEKSAFSVIENVPGSITYASWAGKRFWEFVLSTDYLNPVALDGYSPLDPDYPVITSIGVAYLPEKQTLLQPLFDWGARLIGSGVVQGLMDRFGVWPAENLMPAGTPDIQPTPVAAE